MLLVAIDGSTVVQPVVGAQSADGVEGSVAFVAARLADGVEELGVGEVLAGHVGDGG